ncbi:hypothetical protein FB45DRAFT_1080033 [Roridomyces roridus]|uniref:Uncharacterized protein n=1 Tax=Roridomyces roridus TaxID=1738132 RepID=A0AAD7FMK0_9AGAR|nr:hypothetical protein FB45DRAFT_1080033 [Roridomyces roridus]
MQLSMSDSVRTPTRASRFHRQTSQGRHAKPQIMLPRRTHIRWALSGSSLSEARESPSSRNNSYSNPCQRFHKSITSYPHLTTLVEELRIVLVGSETSFEYNADGQYPEERHPSWVMSSQTLALVLPLFSYRLRHISVIENLPGNGTAAGTSA